MKTRHLWESYSGVDVTSAAVWSLDISHFELLNHIQMTIPTYVAHLDSQGVEGKPPSSGE